MNDQARITELEVAIRQHRDQKADDRCIEDDDRLYGVLGDGIPCDRRVGDKAAMLANCARFIERRCQGGYWPDYVDLEDRVKALEACAVAEHPQRAFVELVMQQRNEAWTKIAELKAQLRRLR